MATTVALTERYRELYASGNKMAVGYLAQISGTYPASGGVTINNDAYPSAAQVFKKIYGIQFDFGQLDFENALYYHVDPSTLDNSDSTNPEFELDVYEDSTGGGFTELTAGGTVPANCQCYIRVFGVPKGGIDGDQI